MRVIGLTGGIACGKSHISSQLSALGVPIIDGDLLSRELTAPGGAALSELRVAFGDSIFCSDGTLNRAALGQRVFGKPDALARLDAIMQPMIRRLITERMAALEAADVPLCVLDMPLLYEKGLDALCDRVWCASLPQEMQLERLMNRDGCTREAAEKRIASQLPTEEKARRANIVIDTRGTPAETAALIPPLLQEEMRLAAL